MTFQAEIQKAADLLGKAGQAVAFTGAGISTPSGIPDFRSAGSGQWAKNDPMQVASLTAFRHRPQVFFDWLRPLARTSWEARPNPAHLGLAALEQKGILKAVITQNIDGLHQAAGSHRVLEVHGSMRTGACSRCGKRYPLVQFRAEFLDGGMPHCPACQGLVKPDIVLFEESLPVDVWDEAHELCQAADVILVVGSSLEVVPAAGLPLTAVQHGAALIINNRTPTFLDPRAEVLLPSDVAETIPQIVNAL
jgi:NAD-dependent deacetylase